jgi:hypothetical protein
MPTIAERARLLTVHEVAPLLAVSEDTVETMSADLAKWRSTLPPGFAYMVFNALRQVSAAGVLALRDDPIKRSTLARTRRRNRARCAC